MRLFGTDGVRGVANVELTPELALNLGRSAAVVLGERAGRPPRVLVGRDTRRSCDLLESALVAGALSVGADVMRLGVVTTPGVAHLVRALDVEAGAVISASHNPAEYNGIKLFDHSGFKLPDEVEDAIDARMGGGAWPRPSGAGLGRAGEPSGALERYLDFLAAGAGGSLQGLDVVVDCANGAASHLGPEALRHAGARVTTIHDAPDGLNINLGCGSLHPADLQAAVRQAGADLGLAFDGDADRVIAVDAGGAVVDGDQVMAVIGLHLLRRGELPHGTVVGTVMSNLGLDLCLRAAGGRLVRTAVGDRYVLEEMQRGGYGLGGEQSGHVILMPPHTTGDGILTALRLGAIVRAAERPLAELAACMPRLPQVLVNVPVARKGEVAASPAVSQAVRRAERALGSRGRVLVRPSGTEPLVRVMLEGEDEERVRSLADDLATVVAGVGGGAGSGTGDAEGADARGK